MATLERNRVIRPSTRDAASSYKVDCKKVTANDKLIINITHESDSSINFRYEISGREISGKNSLHFDATKAGTNWLINWHGDPKPRRVI